MKKKILSLCLVLALVVTAIVGGTMAYFTDTDKEVNTFTVGDVKIDLIESQYHRVNAGEGETTAQEPLVGPYLWASNVKLEGTPDNTPNYKTSNEKWSGKYFSDDQILADAATYKTGYFAEHAENMVPGSNVRKNPYVHNIGKNDAYVRVRALVAADLDDKVISGYYTGTAINYGEVILGDVTQVERDGVVYNQYTFTYVDTLKPGELTFWNVWGNIWIPKDATAEDLANIDSFDITFEADAIQAQGFESAVKAFEAFDAAIDNK